MRASVALATVILLFLSGAGTSAQPAGRNLIGYYPSWAVYARDYHVPDIPAELIHVINYAFAKIEDGEIALGDPYADIDKWYPGDSWDPDSLRGSFHRLQILKREQPHVRTLISVGGWTWSTYFSDVALTPASRAAFAHSCVAFVQRYGFDGVDLDWEYPVSGGHPGNIYRPEDRENFTLLLAELREQLDAAGDYLLTIAAPASPLIIPNLEVALIHPYLDWINIMTYDFHGPWNGAFDQVTNFNAPLHPAPEDPTPEPAHSAFNLAAAVQTYLELGVPSAKLNPGLAFYGRGYGMVADQNDGLFAGYEGPAWNGTWEPGVFDYWDLRDHYIDQGGYVARWHDAAAVPWLWNDGARVMISYDDPASIARKAQYILQEDLGGAMFWEFSADREAELLTTLHEVLTAGLSSAQEAPGPRHGPARAALSLSPNPAGGLVRIGYRVPSRQPVRVTIYDSAGQCVRALPARRLSAGPQATFWDGHDERGRPVPRGLYFVEVAGSTFGASRRLVRVE